MAGSVASSSYGNFPNVVHAVQWWSEQAPERTALTFLGDGENETEKLTYAELDRAARRVAASLRAKMDAGSRALLCFQSGLDFAVAYLGCLYGQIIAVPMFPPRGTRHLDRLAAIVDDAAATVALTNAQAMNSLRTKKMSAVLDLPWQVIDTAETSEAKHWRVPAISPTDIAFLQYTSGSTSTPKGVMVAHENLTTNINMMNEAFHLDDHPDGGCVTWLPVHHDMGLIGCMLTPLWKGFFTVIMPPIAFSYNPARWLSAMSKYRATLTMAPNFAYELCSRMVSKDTISTLDLSTLRTVCNGAEPIRLDTVEKFCTKFESAGFRPSAFFLSYGLAEATLFATGNYPGPDASLQADKADLRLGKATPAREGAEFRTVVNCGSPRRGGRVVIANPRTGRESGDGEVGEIWLAGGHVAQGYWNNPSATAETFHATLPTQGDVSFLRTGDLGFIKEGNLFVTGRLKDIIIVSGENHYPHDIEAIVEDNPAIRPSSSVAFYLEHNGSEGVGIVAEIDIASLRGDLMRVAEEVSTAIYEAHGIRALKIAFLKPAALPKTSSGKKRRQHTRDLLQANRLNEVFRWPPRGEEADRPAVYSNGGPDSAEISRHAAADIISPDEFRERLLTLPPPDAMRLMLNLVRTELSVLLDLPSPSIIDAERSLHLIGLDSLKTLELRKRLSAAIGFPLPEHLLRQRGTVADLGNTILEILLIHIADPDSRTRDDPAETGTIAYEQEVL
jgi:acyl-CoA synthetase (AMP-forming)/AMP-acid ligase II/acyl carrier protein